MKDNELQETMTETATQESKSTPDHTQIQTIKTCIATATDGFDIHFGQLDGYQTVLFFYPQNGLPGVTQLAQDFAEHYESFKQIKTCVFGVSIESLEATQAFKDSLNLPFPLISDDQCELSNWFKTLTERTIFDDTIQTNEQSSFLINGDGKVIRSWRGPEISGHVLEVVEAAHKSGEHLGSVNI